MKNIIKHMDKKLFIATLILFSFGLIMIFSASNVTAYMNGASPSRYFIKQLVWLVGSFIFASTIMIRIPTSKYKNLSGIALVLVTGLIFIALLYGAIINGANAWLGIGGIGGQPSELAKVVGIVWMSCYYGNRKNVKDYNSQGKMFFPLGIVIGIVVVIAFQNDFGTAFIFLLISLFIFFISSATKKVKLIAFATGAFLGITVLLLVLNGTVKILPADKMARLDFTNPCSKFINEGNQVCNSYIAINNGGILGKGLGNSTQKYLHLPEAHTDFIFAIIAEEVGFIGAIGLILFYLFVLIRIIYIGKRADKDYNALICYGVAFYLFLHMAVNLGGVMGIIPITGIPLAFMSYGGSFALSTICALTLVQRISYETNFHKNQG